MKRKLIFGVVAALIIAQLFLDAWLFQELRRPKHTASSRSESWYVKQAGNTLIRSSNSGVVEMLDPATRIWVRIGDKPSGPEDWGDELWKVAPAFDPATAVSDEPWKDDPIGLVEVEPPAMVDQNGVFNPAIAYKVGGTYDGVEGSKWTYIGGDWTLRMAWKIVNSKGQNVMPRPTPGRGAGSIYSHSDWRDSLGQMWRYTGDLDESGFPLVGQ